MGVAGDDVDLGAVESRQIDHGPEKRGVSLFGFQIADVLTDENIIVDLERDGVLKVRADGENCRAFDSLTPASFTLRASRLCRSRPRGSAL